MILSPIVAPVFRFLFNPLPHGTHAMGLGPRFDFEVCTCGQHPPGNCLERCLDPKRQLLNAKHLRKPFANEAVRQYGDTLSEVRV